MILQGREGREKERVRNISVREQHRLVAFGMHPRGRNLQPRHVPCPGAKPGSVGSWDDTQPLSPPSQGLIWMLFISFPCLTALARTFGVVLSRSGER